jgi:hypothetical protein
VPLARLHRRIGISEGGEDLDASPEPDHAKVTG